MTLILEARPFSLLLRSYNNRGQAHLSKGHREQAKGHREQAIADFRKALELQPGQLDAVQGLKRLGLTP
jgi:tetratricopeptide (TPR) repeat protein